MTRIAALVRARSRFALVRTSLFSLMLAASAALAGAAAHSDEPVADPAAPKLADFGWLAGHWRFEQNGRVVEEVWLPSRGGLLIGLNRTTTPRGSDFEFLRIDERDGVIAYLASPGGRPPTVFPLKSLEGQVAEFENPGNDFPKRIRYVRNGDTLVASIHGDDDKSMSWEWKLVTALE